MKAQVMAFAFLVSLVWTNSSMAQQSVPDAGPLPVTEATSIKYYSVEFQPLTIAQQRARFEAEQRMYRTEWYNWLGYSPLRPTVNANFMSNTAPRYFIPSRGVVIHTGQTRAWYW